MDSLVDRFVRNSKFCITAKAGFGEEVDMSWLPLDSRLQEPLLLSKWLSPNYRSRAKAGEVSCSVVTLMRGTGSNRLLIFFRGTVAFLGGTITVRLIEVLLNVPERLGEHAVVAWINERIADKLGIGNPSITQVIEFASAWGPPAVIAAMGLSGWVYAFHVRRKHRDLLPVAQSPAIENGLESRSIPKETPAPAGLSGNAGRREESEKIIGRVGALVSQGSSLLSTWSSWNDSSQATSELRAWLIEAQQINSILNHTEWDRYSAELKEVIEREPSSGRAYSNAYKKVERVHAIMSQLLAALKLEAGQS